MTNKWENQQYENYNDKFEGYNNKYDHDNYAALAIMNGRIDLQKEPFLLLVISDE